MSEQNVTEVIDGYPYVEELSLIHLYTLSIVFVVIYAFFFIISTTLYAKEKSFIQNLPRRDVNVGRDLLSKIVGSERAFAKSVTFPPPGLGDPGYDMLMDEVTHEKNPFHYQTVVAHSYITLDAQVTNFFPELKLKPNQTISEYIDMLKEKLPGISHRACDNYIKTYEFARFSNRQWTKEDFNEWCGFLQELTQSIEQEYRARQMNKESRQISLVRETSEESSEDTEDLHPL